VPQATALMLEPVEQPQNFAGEGVAVIAVALVALVTAVEIALASKPFTMAYRAPTYAAPSTSYGQKIKSIRKSGNYLIPA